MDADTPEPDDDLGDVSRRPQDPFVARRKPTPQHVPERTVVLSGLLGDSDRAGHRRLYFNTRLDYYAEFATDDVLATESVPADQAPHRGLESTRVTLRRAAQISFTRVRSAEPVDEFDLDVRLGVFGTPGAARMPPAETWEVGCGGPPPPKSEVCSVFCATDGGAGCRTGFTDCHQRTCNTCPGGDCETNRTCECTNTCETCHTCPYPCTVHPFPTTPCPTGLLCRQ